MRPPLARGFAAPTCCGAVLVSLTPVDGFQRWISGARMSIQISVPVRASHDGPSPRLAVARTAMSKVTGRYSHSVEHTGLPNQDEPPKAPKPPKPPTPAGKRIFPAKPLQALIV